MMHKSVLSEEILSALMLEPGEHIIDATIGEGGHARQILAHTGPNGYVLGIDRDKGQLDAARKELHSFGSRVVYIHDSFAHLEQIVQGDSFLSGLLWKAVLFDLGWSQAQMESSGKGFSFLKDEPLDMRYDSSQGISAKDLLRHESEESLKKLFWNYGQERFALPIARAIVSVRKRQPIESTFQLVDVIKRAVPRWHGGRRIHPATKVFQALRIKVNNEFEHISKGLEGALHIIDKGGKIVVISFHSDEDRVVKQRFQFFEKEGNGVRITKKPIIPSAKEVNTNPRARSAKLRIFQKY